VWLGSSLDASAEQRNAKKNAAVVPFVVAHPKGDANHEKKHHPF
jgi:hypothetical protein